MTDPFDTPDDPEGPSSADLDRFGDQFVTCPECGSLVYDEAEICQACGRALTQPERSLPLWAWVALGLALLTFLVIAIL